MEVAGQLARNTAFHIGQDFLAEHSLSELADHLGVTDRQMRRAFGEEFGVSPVEFWQTQRLLLAKQLLTDSSISVISVAMASGFKSLRRFNALLKQRYRLTPTELRKQQKSEAPGEFSEFAFRLSYRPPLDWERMLRFFSFRAIAQVEAVQDGSYFRTVRLTRQGREFAGHLRVSHESDRHMLAVRLSDGLLPVCAIVLERIKRLFDLHADPVAIESALGEWCASRPGLRVPGCFDGFEYACRAILGQQISMAGARTLAGRLVQRYGTPIATPIPLLSHAFPTPRQIASARADAIMKLGITRRRAETLIALAGAVASGAVLLEPGRRVEETMLQLRRIPGIGEWTAQCIAMRALAWPDAFPHTDLGIRKGMGESNPRKILERAERWRPWRAYAAQHLWASLETSQ
jgi:AraC family transcriptional regulator of adaptative response / DNA-3-methyladenine glycosylase II